MSRPFNKDFTCPLCHRLHAIRQCSRFIVMPPQQKLKIVAQNALCSNCLAQSHTRAECRSISRCHSCRQDHNSLLHKLRENSVWVQMTAHLKVQTVPGRDIFSTRALLDPTSSRSSITRCEAESMGCEIINGRIKIIVLHDGAHSNNFEVELVVEDQRYGPSPSFSVDRLFREENDYGSANRFWNRSLEYFLILGSDVMSRVLIGPAKGKPGGLYVQETVFGLAYFGEADKQEQIKF